MARLLPASSSASRIIAKSPMNWARCWWWMRWRPWREFRWTWTKQGIDICFSGSQKAISAPPGMAPITVNTRVEEVMHARKEPVRSWYFDLTSAMSYWGKERLYHHTPPITLIYAMREALRAVLEEGLEARWERHAAQPAGPDRRTRSDGPRAIRFESGRSPGHRDGSQHSGWNRRRESAPAIARRIQYRNRRRPRARSRVKSGASA